MGISRNRGVRTVLCLAVLFTLFPVATVLAQEGDEGGDLDALELQIRQKEMELELAQMEAKLKFELELANLELEKKKIDIQAHRRRLEDHGGGGRAVVGLFLLVMFVVNLLAAIWVYLDIRKRNAGSGIWIVITFFTGLFGSLIYCLIRLGDIKAENPAPTKTTAQD